MARRFEWHVPTACSAGRKSPESSRRPRAPSHDAGAREVRDFQQRVRGSIGTQADRNALYEQLEGWLHDLKVLTLIAFRYREQHDFFNRVFNPFDVSEGCPPAGRQSSSSSSTTTW